MSKMPFYIDCLYLSALGSVTLRSRFSCLLGLGMTVGGRAASGLWSDGVSGRHVIMENSSLSTQIHLHSLCCFCKLCIPSEPSMRSLLPSKPQSCFGRLRNNGFSTCLCFQLSLFPAVLGLDFIGNLAEFLVSSLMGHPGADLE